MALDVMSDHQMKKQMGHQRKISGTTEFKDMTKKVNKRLARRPLDSIRFDRFAGLVAPTGRRIGEVVDYVPAT